MPQANLLPLRVGTEMDFLETIRAHKREGEREWARQQEEQRQRQEAEAARLRAEEEQRRRAEEQKHQAKAQEVYAMVPGLVRDAAARGLAAAVLPDSFVEDRAPANERSCCVTLNRRTCYLKGWLIPFYEICQRDRIPLTLVTEQVDVGLKSIVRRSFHLLAVDLKQL